MNIAALLAKTARTFPDLTAVSRADEPVLSHAGLQGRVARLALSLREGFRLTPGERVAIAMKNSPDYYPILFGIWHAGLAAVPINAKLHPKELAYVLDHSGARIAFVDEDLAHGIAAEVAGIESLARVISTVETDYEALFAGEAMALADAAPDDLAWLFYTSGTTGRPKGAMLSHRNLLAASEAYLADVDTISPGDAIVHAAPISHGSGMYGIPHLAKGGNQVIPASGHFDPGEVFDLIAHYPGTSFFFAPTMVVRLINAPKAASARLDNLKLLIYAGGPMYLEDSLKALDVLGPRLAQIYGQGESPMTITTLSKAFHFDRHHPRYLVRLASAGVPFTCVEVRVLDGEDRELPAGEAGEVVVRGAPVMLGYWRNEEASAEALRGGWLHTGDVGAFDADGFLTLKDRSKDMIISGGSNVYPREIEEVLLKDPRVLECSVVGAPHPEWGEEVVAFLVARPGQEVREAELDRLCLDNIARFKRPRRYLFVEALPKNNYGKVLKTELRERLAASVAPAPASAPAPGA